MLARSWRSVQVPLIFFDFFLTVFMVCLWFAEMLDYWFCVDFFHGFVFGLLSCFNYSFCVDNFQVRTETQGHCIDDSVQQVEGV